ncbi:hypothetical protein [Streptomyces tsukubensis]|uniref:Uncharacterized protein n=1 Tax=Streptomyces tsukubensis TaxID=83656 RepID=A0A1V4A5I3_9ACTN|nr:hypothetical protein [Streptomyces tsukubensis]OON75599.1 hypothetical protein B1H18_22295 [Streptomyces tsukubensis]QFR94418.1 hypothetical protein GBW32_16905 [Streptomyces tsukubensis]
MIVIGAGAEQSVDPAEDELGRDRIGYGPTMSPMALYDATHGTWHLGERAHRERFALITHDERGVLAVAIDRIEPAPASPGRQSSGRSVIHGQILANGHPIYDAHVGARSPIARQRNPIGYFDAPEERTVCACGCGEEIPVGKHFASGHDQTALHERVRQLGGVVDFIAWFDRVHGNWPDINVIYEPVNLKDGTPTGAPARARHRLGCDHFYLDEDGRVINRPRLASAEEMTSLRPCRTCQNVSAKASARQ